MLRLIKFERDPKLDGSEPDMQFPEIENVFKYGMFPIDDGIKPASFLELRLNLTTLLLLQTTPVQGVTQIDCTGTSPTQLQPFVSEDFVESARENAHIAVVSESTDGAMVGATVGAGDGSGDGSPVG